MQYILCYKSKYRNFSKLNVIKLRSVKNLNLYLKSKHRCRFAGNPFENLFGIMPQIEIQEFLKTQYLASKKVSFKMFMLINYFFFLGSVATIILRSDDNADFSAMFSNKYFGKLQDLVLLRENNLDFIQCLLICIKHLDCKSVNYNQRESKCLLMKNALRKDDVEELDGWEAFGTVFDEEHVSC